MADDFAVALCDTLQLPHLRIILAVHERASGGLNNWLKTYGLRIGSLRGSTVLPPDWDPTHVSFSLDIRYLGVFLGDPTLILSHW